MDILNIMRRPSLFFEVNPLDCRGFVAVKLIKRF